MNPPSKIFRSSVFALLGVVGLGGGSVLFLSGCGRPSDTGAVEAPEKKGDGREGKAFSTSWQDETQYIVESVLADLAGLSIFARTGRQFPIGELSVTTSETRVDGHLAYQATLNLPGGEVVEGSVILRGSVWDPETYAAIADKLCEGIQASQEGVDSVSLVNSLLTPTPDVLVKESDAASSYLKNKPSDPQAHVNSAILLGAFALREASGKFFTVRAELNRMTACLALAEALEKNAMGNVQSDRTARRLAETLLLTLQNNQRGALAVLGELPEDGAYGGWKNALRTRITGDYRPLLESEGRTLLETRELVRAGVDRLKADSMIGSPAWAEVLNETSDEKLDLLPDWGRLLALAPGSMAVKHILYGDSQLLRAEVAEAGYAQEKIQKIEGGENKLAESLNEQVRPFGAGGDGDGLPAILDWAFWAGQYHRHICNTLIDEADFLQNDWGVDERAEQFRDQADEAFSSLRLYPFVQVVTAVRDSDYREAQEEARSVMMSSPQEVGPEIWNHTCYTNPHVEYYVPPPHAYVNEWHRHNPPPGTAYDPLPRMNQPSLVEGIGALERVEALHQLAPYDPDISFNLLRIMGRGPDQPAPYDEFLRIYSPVSEYDAVIMSELAKRAENEPAEYEKWMKKAISLSPDYKPRLAAHYRDRGMAGEAVKLYLEWIGETTDLIPGDVSMYVVGYLEDNGRRREADAIAERVATSYSYSGLQTKAFLLERRGDLGGAYKEHKKIVERYNDNGSLLPFLIRSLEQGRDKMVPERLRSLMEDDLSSMGYASAGDILVPHLRTDTKPKMGVVVQIDDQTTRGVGLKAGDIIVAVRGYSVKDWESFKILRNFIPDEPYTAIVWRDKRYIEIPPIDPNHRFSEDLKSYSHEP